MTTYAEVRARILERQPPQLAEYRQRLAREKAARLEAATTEPQPHDPESDHLVSGTTRQVFDVEDARVQNVAPERHGRPRRPRRWFCVYHNRHHARDEACTVRLGNLQTSRR